MAATDESSSELTCSCYGCTIGRQRAGIPAPDRSADLCNPSDACVKDGQCWTHSEWVDTARCDPLNACANRILCGAHGVVRS